MSVFQTKPQRAAASARPSAAAKSAGVAMARMTSKDALVPRFVKVDTAAATDPITVQIFVTRQSNNTTEPTSTRVAVWFSTTKDGPLGGTQTLGSFTNGGIVATESANQSYLMYSDADGKIVFDLTKPTAGSVFVRAQIGGQVVTQEYVWT